MLGRLSSLDDVTELRRLANLEARRARQAGEEGRSDHYLAVAEEAQEILEAAICLAEPPLPSVAA